MTSSRSFARCSGAPRAGMLATVLALLGACSDGQVHDDGAVDPGTSVSPGSGIAGDAGATTHVDAGAGCPQDAVRGRGRHRLFMQGHGAEPDVRGIYPMLHEWTAGGGDALLCDDARFVNDANGDGRWTPPEEPKPLGPAALVHGEHFIVGAGSYVEFATTLCEDITGNVTFYIPNYDEPGSRVLHELFVVHDGSEQRIADTIDEEAGNNGYSPFVRVIEGIDPVAMAGDELLLRSTNLSGVPFSVMVFSPPSEYESWIVVEVP